MQKGFLKFETGFYDGEFKKGKRNGWGLYTWPSGHALFRKWEPQGVYNSDSTAHTVFPALKQSFNALDLDQRKVIQYALTEMGYYNSSIDGKWGRNTLNALAEFAVLRMRTINLNRRDIAQNVIIEVAKVALDQMSLGQFLITPHEIVKKYIKIKADNTDKWILGMRKLYKKFIK